MNKRLLKNITFDFAVLYSLIAIYLFSENLRPYAENALTFFGGFVLLVSVLAFFWIDDVAKKRIERGHGERTKAHALYCGISTLIEVVIFAALGWYWMACAFALSWFVGQMIEDRL